MTSRAEQAVRVLYHLNSQERESGTELVVRGIPFSEIVDVVIEEYRKKGGEERLMIIPEIIHLFDAQEVADVLVQLEGTLKE